MSQRARTLILRERPPFGTASKPAAAKDGPPAHAVYHAGAMCAPSLQGGIADASGS